MTLSFSYHVELELMGFMRERKENKRFRTSF